MRRIFLAARHVPLAAQLWNDDDDAMMPGPCDLHDPEQLVQFGPDFQHIDKQYEQFVVAAAGQRARRARTRTSTFSGAASR